MSLDVWLEMPGERAQQEDRIYIREDGQTKAITRAEWDARHPDRNPFVVREPFESSTVFSANITHNLNKMAQEAGIYEALWRPEEINITLAKDLIALLRDGLALLQSDPARFRAFNPSNGWGDYEGLGEFVANYLAACERYPEAEIHVSR